MGGHLIADDHPHWARIEVAVEATRNGDPGTLDTITREIAHRMGDGVDRRQLGTDQGFFQIFGTE